MQHVSGVVMQRDFRNPHQEECGGVNVVRQIVTITAFAVPAKLQLAKEFGFPHRKGKDSRTAKLTRHVKDGPRIWLPTPVVL